MEDLETVRGTRPAPRSEGEKCVGLGFVRQPDQGSLALRLYARRDAPTGYVRWDFKRPERTYSNGG